MLQVLKWVINWRAFNRRASRAETIDCIKRPASGFGMDGHPWSNHEVGTSFRNDKKRLCDRVRRLVYSGANCFCERVICLIFLIETKVEIILFFVIGKANL